MEKTLAKKKKELEEMETRNKMQQNNKVKPKDTGLCSQINSQTNSQADLFDDFDNDEISIEEIDRVMSQAGEKCSQVSVTKVTRRSIKTEKEDKPSTSQQKNSDSDILSD